MVATSGRKGQEARKCVPGAGQRDFDGVPVDHGDHVPTTRGVQMQTQRGAALVLSSELQATTKLSGCAL